MSGTQPPTVSGTHPSAGAFTEPDGICSSGYPRSNATMGQADGWLGPQTPADVLATPHWTTNNSSAPVPEVDHVSETVLDFTQRSASQPIVQGLAPRPLHSGSGVFIQNGTAVKPSGFASTDRVLLHQNNQGEIAAGINALPTPSFPVHHRSQDRILRSMTVTCMPTVSMLRCLTFSRCLSVEE